MSRDAEHLHLLAIFHYVHAGLVGLGCVATLLPLLLGVGVMGGAFGPHDDDAPPEIIGGFFVVIGAIAFIFLATCAAFLGYAGKCLSAKRNYSFCVAVAAIQCVFFPLGTALGIFTIIVLQRSGVRELFYPGSHPPA